MKKIAISISGMTCGGCVNSVRNALLQISGVTDAQVKVGAARVTYDPVRTSPEVLRGAIVRAGYALAETSGAGATTGTDGHLFGYSEKR